MIQERDNYLIVPGSKWIYNDIPYPPLGIAYLSAAGKEVGIPSKIIDGQFTSDLRNQISEASSTHGPVLVGVSSTLLQLPEAVQIAREIKHANKASLIVFGGAGPNCLPTSDFHQYAGDCVDVVCLQEGELAWQEMLKQYYGSMNKDNELSNARYLFENIAGLLINDGQSFRLTKPRRLLRNLDSLPMPDLDGIYAKKYIDTWRTNGGMGSISLLPSRGCPFGCCFCSKTISGKAFRHHSPERIVNEMERITQNYGFNIDKDEIFLFDDNLSTNRKIMVDMSEELIKRGLHVNWSCQARVNTVDPELLRLMAASGCKEIYFGQETVSPNLLKYLGKDITADQGAQAIALSRAAGMKPGIFIIVGIPGEKRKDIEAIADFIRKTKPAHVDFSVLTPFPGTELYERTFHLIKPEYKNQYGIWDDTRYSVYQPDVFEVDPETSINYLDEIFQDTLATSGVDYNTSQFVKRRYSD